MNAIRFFQRAAVAAAAASLGVVAFAGTGHALSGDPVTLTGTVSCNPTTGHQVVAWTLSNPSGTSITISTGFVDGSGMSAGEPLDAETVLSPEVIPNGGTATGSTQVSGDGVGDLHLVLTYAYADLDPELDGEVVLPGGCLPSSSTTTTTAAPTTTTTRAAAVAAAAVAPHFTG